MASISSAQIRKKDPPDKLTAEIRQVPPWPARSATAKPAASIAWSLTPEGPWHSLWAHNPDLTWKDGDAITRTLLWPEVDKQVRSLPPPTSAVYVRFSFDGMAIDDFRLAYIRSGLRSSNGTVTHVWRENGVEKRSTEPIAEGARAYSIELPTGSTIQNIALIMECPAATKPKTKPKK